jgi:nitrite reductase/ring-hydroxylating ferredoxin subunit/uncharacterized membrane protein
MRNFLQGKWLGHPLHPLLVHLPIGFFFLSLILDILSYVTALPALVPGAFYAIGLGIVLAFVASIPGLADYSDIRRDAPAKKKARLHMVLNFAAVAAYLLSLLLRYPVLDSDAPPIAAFAAALVGVGLLSYSGYVGGELVYDEGVGVGRHRRDCPLPDETIVLPGLPGEFVAVAEAASLKPGHTLRAEINKTVVAVANLDGTFYAFQEFCTHRYAPLSEGTFAGKQVICPWHGSCFDMRTGEVKEGPAKVPLKVFAVRVREGKIEVQAEA